jgi:hypothetical protein
MKIKEKKVDYHYYMKEFIGDEIDLYNNLKPRKREVYNKHTLIEAQDESGY